MPIPTISDISDNKNTGRKRKEWKHPVPVPVVSQETRDRLYAEAVAHPNFEGKTLAQIRAFIDDWLTTFLADQPFWYGHTGGPEGADVAHHTAQRKHHARREKEQHDREMARAKPTVSATVASGQKEENGEGEKGGERIDQEKAEEKSEEKTAISTEIA